MAGSPPVNSRELSAGISIRATASSLGTTTSVPYDGDGVLFDSAIKGPWFGFNIKL
jgi:hypothetical protein